ncbi:MAG: hypothetical protein SFW64_00460 [Alphaproteobacteria bacterium]|nr:hypothetical protein [Alphaproteobacteria bacterium]
MGQATHYLDYNQLYSLLLDYDAATQRLKITFQNPNEHWDRFPRAVLKQLNLAEIAPTQPSASPSSKPTSYGKSVTFYKVSREFTLRMGEEPIGTYSISNTGTLTATYHRPLTVDETRRIGTFHECPPYSQRRSGLTSEENQSLLAEAKQAVFTDIHTHSSGQISASGLLAVAMRQRPYYYPIALMRDAGIDTSYSAIPEKHRQQIPRVPFPPLELAGVNYPALVDAADLHALSSDNLKKLAAQMALPADHQSTFSNLEYDGNRFRYPLSKDSSLTIAIRKKEAEEYAAQGIETALTSFVGIDKPQTLRAIHTAVEELHAHPKTPNFVQRYMVGIPRGLSSEEIQAALEKAKISLDSPYIMGVDMLGYESDKTKKFITMLDSYAAWANEHKPGSFIRVHAGENDKNHDNVKDFLKVAIKYPNLKFLVGHGIYGMDEETLGLCKKLDNQITVELNPSSNIALNNIDDVRQLPFDALLNNHIPFVVSSDSAGMYQTDALQLGLSAYYGGLTHEGFQAMRKHQQHLVDHLHDYSKSAAQPIPNWETSEGKEAWLDDMTARLGKVPSASPPPIVTIDADHITKKLKTDQVSLIESGTLPPELKGKYPVTIIGASGASWRRLSPSQQRENAIAIDMLIHALGENCYIVQGRNKKEGLSKVINQSLTASNSTRKENETPELYNVGLYMNPSFDDSHSYKHLSHMIHIEGQPLGLARAIVDHTFDHEGALIAVGGAAYTRDTIHEADQRGIRDNHPGNRKMMLLLSNTEGASKEKANRLHPDYQAIDGHQLIRKLHHNRGDLFPKTFALRDLDRLYNESAARVTTYGYNIADSAVSEPQLLARQPVPTPKSAPKIWR